MSKLHGPSWTELTVDIPDDYVELILAELSDVCSGFHEAPSVHQRRTRLSLYVRPNSSVEPIRGHLASFLARYGLGATTIDVVALEDRDWSEEWKKSLASFPVGSGFMVVPSWVQAPDTDRAILRLDPGRAFGTGTHESTQLCVELLESSIRPGLRVFDIGTGSGILAIAARKLHAATVTACDTDPEAVEVAKENLRRNGAEDVRLFVGSADAVRSASADLVVANLTADLIRYAWIDIERILAPGGSVILSGILEVQLPEIHALVGGTRAIRELRTRGEWSALVFEEHGR